MNNPNRWMSMSRSRESLLREFERERSLFRQFRQPWLETEELRAQNDAEEQRWTALIAKVRSMPEVSGSTGLIVRSELVDAFDIPYDEQPDELRSQLT
jgi:hypothetical protein